jgi:acetyl esterase/lipase
MGSKGSKFKKAALAVSAAALTVISAFATSASAQADTAHVPFVVNANATVKAVPQPETAYIVQSVEITVTANQDKTLAIPLPKTLGVLNGAHSRLNVPTVVSNRAGKVTVNLSAQSYQKAEISLYAVNGKRILRSAAVASEAAKTISRGNLTAGAYLLSIKGADGNAVTSRLTHNGGNLDISVGFNVENTFNAKQLAKQMADGKWTITLKASGFSDSSYTLVPVKGTNPKQTINLRAAAAADPIPSSRKATNVRYASEFKGKNDRQLDISWPSSGDGPFPLVIYVHGGGFTSGDKSSLTGEFSKATSHGYAFVSISHRLASNSQRGFPEGLQDITAAIRFLRANAVKYHLDPDHFAMTGFSAGGYHAGMIGVLSGAKHDFDVDSIGYPGVSSAVQAAIGLSGLTDFSKLDEEQKTLGGSWMMSTHYGSGSMLSQYLGITTTASNIPPKSNPVTYISANTIPIMMMHGDKDNLVPWMQSELLVEAINKVATNKATFVKIANGEHGSKYGNQESTVFDFLDKHLKVKK